MFFHQPSTFFMRTLSNTIIMIVVLASALVLTTAAAWEYRLGNNSTTVSPGYIVGRIEVRQTSSSPWKYVCFAAGLLDELKSFCSALGLASRTIGRASSSTFGSLVTPTTMQQMVPPPRSGRTPAIFAGR